MNGEGWSDSHTGWIKVHLSITQADQTNVPNQKFGWKPYLLFLNLKAGVLPHHIRRIRNRVLTIVVIT